MIHHLRNVYKRQWLLYKPFTKSLELNPQEKRGGTSPSGRSGIASKVGAKAKARDKRGLIMNGYYQVLLK